MKVRGIGLTCLIAGLFMSGGLVGRAAMSSLSAGTGQPSFNLLELASNQGVKPIVSEDQKIFLYSFTRGGVQRDALVLTPGAAFDSGPLTTENRRTCVSVFVAMPFNLGDGAILTISTIGKAEESEALRLNIDPAHNREHRAWIPLRIRLPKATSPIHIRFRVTAGPLGDGTGDWIGIAPGPDPECLLAKPDDRRQTQGENR